MTQRRRTSSVSAVAAAQAAASRTRIGAVERVQPLVAAHEHDGDRRRPRDHDRGGERDPLEVAGADLAEQAVADDDEQREDHRDVEQPLGEQRAEHRLLRRLRARRHQEHAHGVARARGQDVVRGVADDVQAVGVGARRRARPPRAAASASARRARAWRGRRARSRRRARPTRPRCPGTCGGSWRSAHQTTPATARTEIATPTSERRETPARAGASIPSSRGRDGVDGESSAPRVREGWQTAPRMAAARELVIADEPAAWAALGFAPDARRPRGARRAARAARRARAAGAGSSRCALDGAAGERRRRAAGRRRRPRGGRGAAGRARTRTARPRSTTSSSSPTTATGPPARSPRRAATCAGAAGRRSCPRRWRSCASAR